MQKDRIPDYVQEQIEKCIAEEETGSVGINSINTAILFVNMARLNNRITEEEAKELREFIRNIESKE